MLRHYTRIQTPEFITYLISSLMLFFTPIYGLLIAVAAAIGLDTLTGIIRDIKLYGWKSFRSRKLSNVVSKMVLYESSILLLYPIDYYLMNELLSPHININYFFTKICCVILLLIELVSIKENFESSFKVNIWGLIKSGLNRAKEVKEDFTNITK
jgi:hypothetical protein